MSSTLLERAIFKIVLVSKKILCLAAVKTERWMQSGMCCADVMRLGHESSKFFSFLHRMVISCCVKYFSFTLELPPRTLPTT